MHIKGMCIVSKIQVTSNLIKENIFSLPCKMLINSPLINYTTCKKLS